MEWPAQAKSRIERDAGDTPRYAIIADAIEQAIVSMRLTRGDRLPTVRQLAHDLDVSVTTIIGAYGRLATDGWIRGDVGRGTYVNGIPSATAGAPSSADLPVGRKSNPADRNAGANVAWRKRSLTVSAGRFKHVFPSLTDCSTGRPDPALLPLPVLRRAWRAAIDAVTPGDLQYAGIDPIEALVERLVPRLQADGVAATGANLVVGSSAQQLMVLAAEVAGIVGGSERLAIAVENPGYPTIFDTFERHGHRLVGIELDEQGATPASLAAALDGGSSLVLLTPRAHNPTGASWTHQRRQELADVLAGHPRVIAIEDDQLAGIAQKRPGSLLSDRRLEDRVVYIRSFSKSIAPDLRIAVAATGPRLRMLLGDAKSHADGWTSRLIQRVLAELLGDPELETMLMAARVAYADRREVAVNVLRAGLAAAGDGEVTGGDGVNIWIHLPRGIDAESVIERAAALGVLLAPGEPFFVRPGRSDVIRFNVGALDRNNAGAVASTILEALTQALGTRTADVVV